MTREYVCDGRYYIMPLEPPVTWERIKAAGFLCASFADRGYAVYSIYDTFRYDKGGKLSFDMEFRIAYKEGTGDVAAIYEGGYRNGFDLEFPAISHSVSAYEYADDIIIEATDWSLKSEVEHHCGAVKQWFLACPVLEEIDVESIEL